MELLKSEPKKLRYVFLTTKTNKVYIYYCLNEDTISESTQTVIENGYISNISGIDPTQTESYSTPNNEIEIDIFNTRIVNYIKTRSETPDMIYIYNCSYSYDILLESRVFYEMSKISHNFTMDLGSSGFRLGDYKYENLSNIKIISGTLVLEGSCELNCNLFEAVSVSMDIYNKVDGNFALNILAPKISINGLQQYSTFKLSLLNSSQNSTSTSCHIQSVNFFGEESLKQDASTERIYIRGFNSCTLGVINVEDTMVYSTLVKFDYINIANIGGVNRNIDQILPGSMFIMGSIASLNLHDLNLVIKENTSLRNNTSLVSFTSISTELTRKLKFFDCNITNNSTQILNLTALNSVSIAKIYTSSCTFTDYVNPIKIYNTASVNALTFNKCTFSSNNNDFTITGAKRISITDTNFNFKSNNIVIDSAEKINIAGGIWKFDTLSISKDSIIKTYIERTEMIGKNMKLINSNYGNEDFEDNVLYLNSVQMCIDDSISVSGSKVTLYDTYIKSKNISIDNSTSITINNSKLKSVNNVCVLTANCSMCGSILLTPESNKEKYTLKIRDKDKFLNINDISVMNISTDYSPILYFDVNRPIKVSLTEITSDYMYTKFVKETDTYGDDLLDGDSEFIIELGDKIGKIINDSTKVVDLVSSTDEYGRLTYNGKVL